MQCGISGFRRSRNVLLPRKRYPLCSRGLCRNICRRRCRRLRVMTCRMLSVCSCCGSRDSVPAHVIFPQCGLSNAGGSTRCFTSAVHRCFSNCGSLCRGMRAVVCGLCSSRCTAVCRSRAGGSSRGNCRRSGAAGRCYRRGIRLRYRSLHRLFGRCLGSSLTGGMCRSCHAGRTCTGECHHCCSLLCCRRCRAVYCRSSD